MKHFASIILFLFLAQIACGQNLPFGYNLKGEEIVDSNRTATMVIYYGSPACHACMEQLAAYATKWAAAENGRHVYVMLPCSDLLFMRQEAASLKAFFPEGVKPNVIYDLNPDPAQRYQNLYDIHHFPTLFFYREDGTMEFFPYEKLFRRERPNFRKIIRP